MPSDLRDIRGRDAAVHRPGIGRIRRIGRIRPIARALGAVALLSVLPAGAADPLATIRAFCRADGDGARLSATTWPQIAELVEWPLEPAWDHVRLISGYQVGTPRTDDGRVAVDVEYTVTADVRPSGIGREQRIETRTYTLEADGAGGWRLRAPPPPPFVFASQADAEALRELLDPTDSPYVSASALVWQLLRGADAEVAYADVASLAGAPGLVPQRTAEAGDLAIYYDGRRPYHVGVVESEDAVVSATLNGGIRRTPFAAFAGEIRYRRPFAPIAAAEPTPATAAESDHRRGPARTPPPTPPARTP